MALLAPWLADFQLLAAALLLGVILAIALLRQPAQRLAVAKSTLTALAALAVLCALPGWSLIHLLNAPPEPAVIASPAALPDLTPPALPTTPRPQFDPSAFAAVPAFEPLTAAPVAPPVEPIDWSVLSVAFYAAGSAAVTLWLVTGAILAHRVRRSATPAPPELEQLLAQITGPAPRPPQLLLSNRIAAPVAIGLRHPAIIIPLPRREGLEEGCPTPQLQSIQKQRAGQDENRASDVEVKFLPILAHEWAHLQHRDLHTLAATRLLLILLWPQPLFWLLRRTIRLDQETLADAAAADRAGRLDYAQQLLAWARTASTQRPPRLAGAVGLWEGPSQLKRRIAVLLNEQFAVMRNCSRQWKWSTAALLSIVALSLSLVTLEASTRAEEENPAAAATAGTVTLRGRILHADGTPVATPGSIVVDSKQAAISYSRDGGDDLTDRFDIEAPSGEIVLKYFSQDAAPTKIGPFTVEPGESRDDLEIRVTPGFAAELIVANERGEAIPNATISASPIFDANRSGVGWPLKADDQGRATLKHAAALPYRIQATAPNYQLLLVEPIEFDAAKPTRLTMTRSPLATGVVRNADDTPASGAVVRQLTSMQASGYSNDSRGDGYGEVVATADEAGRFTLNEVTVGASYLFVIETADNARRWETDVAAGMRDVQVAVPARRDLRCRIVGDLAKLPQRNGQPFVSVRQTKRWRTRIVTVGRDATIAPTAEGGEITYEGLLPGDVEISAGDFSTQVAVNEQGVTEAVLQVAPETNAVAETRKSSTAAAGLPGDENPIATALGFRSRIDAVPNAIHGRCVSDKNEPLADVVVKLYRGDVIRGPQRLVGSVKTNASGDFRFADLVDVEAEYDGKLPTTDAPNEEMFIWSTQKPGLTSREAAGTISDIARDGSANDFVMAPAASLTGTLRDETGRPIANATVAKVGRMTHDSGTFTARSDAEGKFTINDLAPFDLEVERRRDRDAKEQADKELAAGTHSVLTFSLAPAFAASHPKFKTQTLPTSSIPAKDVAVTLSPGERLAGRVVFADGAPAANATVFIKPSIPKGGDWGVLNWERYDRARDYQITLQTDADGRFESNSLTPGTVDVWVDQPGWLNAGVSEFEVKAGEAGTIPDLKLIKGGVVRLQLIDDETGRPINVAEPLTADVTTAMRATIGRREIWPTRYDVTPAGVIEVRTLPGEGKLSIQSIDSAAAPQWQPANSSFDALPRFEIADGQTIDLELRIRKMPQAEKAQASASAAIAAPSDGESQAKEVAERGSALVKQLALAPNVFMGYCIDESGQPLAGVDVSLFVYGGSVNENVEPIARVRTGADGKFEFNEPINVAKEFPNGVPEDQFVTPPVKIIAAVAKAPGLTTEFQNEALYQFVKRGQAAILQMKPAQKLTGRVTDDKGQPVAGAVVTTTASVSGYVPGGNLNVRTDAEGRYTIDDLPRFDAAERAREYAAARERKDPRAVFPPPSPALSVQHPDFANKRVGVKEIPGEVDVALAPAATIRGRVVTPGADAKSPPRPLANVPVFLTRTRQPRTSSDPGFVHMEQQRGVTDADGNYNFTSLPASEYAVTATAPNLTTLGVRGVEAPAGQTVTASDVVLTPGGVVRVKLVDGKTNEPLKLKAGQKGYIHPRRNPSTFYAPDSPSGPETVEPPLIDSPIVAFTADAIGETRLPPGQYDLYVDLPLDGMHLASVTADARPVGGEFEVREGETIERTVPLLEVLPASLGITSVAQPIVQPAEDNNSAEKDESGASDGALHFMPAIAPADSNDEGASLPANVIEIDGQQVILGDPVPIAELRERGIDPAVEPSEVPLQVAPPKALYVAVAPMPAPAPATTPWRPVDGTDVYSPAPLGARKLSAENANKLEIRAVDVQGAPLAGVEASIYRISRLEPAAPRLDRTVATDADGKLLIDKLVSPAEVEHFQILQAQGAFHQGVPEGGFVIALRRPGLATAQIFQSAGPLALYGANRTVRMRPAVKLSGRVTDPDGKPVPGAKVVAGDFLYAIEGIDAVETDADGRYQFNDRAAFNRAESNNQEVRSATALNMYGEPQSPENNSPEDPSARLVSNLVASHPDYAVTRVAGGNVPGVADIQLNPVAPVTGRVVHHGSGAPAAGVTVHVNGWYSVKATTPDGMQSSIGHWATAKSDADGYYRFPNLPPGVYSVWADSGIQLSQAPWVAREEGGIKAVAGDKPTVAPDLVIGPPGVVKVQLVDGETGQPLKLPPGAVVQPSPLPLSDGIERHQLFYTQALPATADGVFETKMIPGQFRMLVFVNKSYTDPQVIWQTDDDIDSAGEIFDLQPGEVISATVKVLSTARIDEMRARYNAASDLMTQGKYAEAIASLSAMVADFPKNKLRFLEQRGQAYSRAGDYASAIADFEAILQVAPDNTTVAYTLAGLLAVSPVDADRDSRRALELASRVKSVAERGHNSDAWLASILEIEAAAHADLGDFKKAIAVQEDGIKLAPAARRKELQDRLELYRAGKPFRLQASPAAAPPKAPAAQGASTSSRLVPLSTKPFETLPAGRFEGRLQVAAPSALLQATEQRSSLTSSATNQSNASNDFTAYWNDVPDSAWKLVPVAQGNQVVAPDPQQALSASTNTVPAGRVNARFEAADDQMIPLSGQALDLVQLGNWPLARVVDSEASIRAAAQHVPATPSESILTGTFNNNQVQLTPVRATPPASIQKVDLIKRPSANEPLNYPIGGLEPQPSPLEFKSATLGDAVK